MRQDYDLPMSDDGRGRRGWEEHEGGRQWIKEETPRDAAMLLDELPSKQLGKL